VCKNVNILIDRTFSLIGEVVQQIKNGKEKNNNQICFQGEHGLPNSVVEGI